MREWINVARRLDEVAAPTSPEFRAWFGQSQLVDQHGDPLILYHGTKKAFDKLRAHNARHHINHKLLFASDSPESASDFAGVPADEEPEGDDQWTGGNVHPIYMRMEKPFCYTELDELGDPPKNPMSAEVLALLGAERYNQLTQYGAWEVLENDEVIAWMKSKGFDGFTAWENGGLSHACFDESQVASIFAFREAR
jgi:hypothetical protein